MIRKAEGEAQKLFKNFKMQEAYARQTYVYALRCQKQALEWVLGDKF
jgi:hypothetical protein